MQSVGEISAFRSDGDRLKIIVAAILDGSGPRSTGSSSALAPADKITHNSIVKAYQVSLTLSGNSWVAVSAAGQTRKTALSTDLLSVVVDFGALVTVDAVALSDGFPYICYRVTPWNGSRFDVSNNVYLATFTQDWTTGLPTDGSPITASGNAEGRTTPFKSEVRTERLQIELKATRAVTASDGDPLANVLVHFPAAPADIELRLNGGAPLWSLAGPAPLSPDKDGGLSFAHTIQLSDALTKLAGNPDDQSALPLNFSLTAKQPGILTFVLKDGGLDNARSVSFIDSVPDVGPGGALELKYESEGTGPGLKLRLPPEATTLSELRFTLVGALPPERVLPPTGPGADASLAKLVLDSTHAACALVPPVGAQALLSELVAVRLPLHAEAAGAEVRAQLWSVLKSGEPDQPIAGATSKPVTLAGQDDAQGFSFVTLAFSKPVPLPADGRVYVALLVARGRVWWSFGTPSSIPLRVGPPAGPWRDLPTPFAADNAFEDLGGRVRLVGHAAHATPLAPLSISVASGPNSSLQSVTATPTAKGVPVVLSLNPALALANDRTVDVQLLSYIGGSVTLKDLQVVFNTTPDGRTLPSAKTKKG